MESSSTQDTNVVPDTSASTEPRFPKTGFHLPRPNGCDNTSDCICLSCRPRINGSTQESSCPCPRCKPHDFVFIPCTPEWLPEVPFVSPHQPWQEEHTNEDFLPSGISTSDHNPISLDWPEGFEEPPRIHVLPGNDDETNPTAPVVTKTWGPMFLPNGFIEKCKGIELRNLLNIPTKIVDPADVPPNVFAKDQKQKEESTSDVGNEEETKGLVEFTKTGDGWDGFSFSGPGALGSGKEDERGGQGIQWGDIPRQPVNPETTGKPSLKDTKSLPWTNYRGLYNASHEGIEFPMQPELYNNDWSNEGSYDTAHVPHTSHFTKLEPSFTHFQSENYRWNERIPRPPTPPRPEPESFNMFLRTAAQDGYTPKLPTVYRYPTPPSLPGQYEYPPPQYPPTQYAYPSTPPQSYYEASYKHSSSNNYRYQSRYSVHQNHARFLSQGKFDTVTAMPNKGRGVYNPHTDKWLQMHIPGDALKNEANNDQTEDRSEVIMDACQTEIDSYGVELPTLFGNGMHCY